MDRFYGYNRSDYYFPRTTREAFGSNFESQINTTFNYEWIIIGICIIVLLITYWGIQ